MKKIDVQQLSLGLYKLYWKKKHGGRTSFAAVGMTYDGSRWMVPVNWTCPEGKPMIAPHNRDVWKSVKKVKLIKS